MAVFKSRRRIVGIAGAVVIAAGAITGGIVLQSSSGTAFTSLGEEYLAAADGDVICIPPGTYGDQVIVRDAAKSATGPAVTFKPCGGKVTMGEIQLGNGGGTNGNTPSWIVFDGLGGDPRTGKGGAAPEWSITGEYAYAEANHITMRGMSIGEAKPSVGGIVVFASPENLLLKHNIIGPGCCGEDPVTHEKGSPINLRLTIREEGADNPTNVTVTENLMQGSVRTCALWDAAYKGKYGPCPSITCTDFNQCHNDVIHSYGCENCVWTGNEVPFYDVQGFFFEEYRGSNVSGKISNNIFGTDVEDTWHAIWGSFGPGATGTWDITFNTLLGSGAITANASKQGQFGTASIYVIGNLGGRLYSDNRECDNSSLNLVYRYNIWGEASYPWLNNCDATDSNYPNATIASWLSPQGQLLPGDTPPHGYVKGGCESVGRTNPCNAGAEWGVSPPPPPPPPPAPVLTTDAVTSSTVRLTWPRLPNVVGYWFYKDGVKVSATNDPTRTFVKFGALPGTRTTLGVEARYAESAARTNRVTYRAVEESP